MRVSYAAIAIVPILAACSGATMPAGDAGDLRDARLADTSVADVADLDARSIVDAGADSALDNSAPDSQGTGDADDGSTAHRDADPRSPNVRVEPGATTDAELVDRLAIGTTSDGAPRRVVLRLSPADLPSLQSGDVLMAPAEVEVTTACDVGQVGPMCGYSPSVAAQIILTGNRDDLDPAGAGSHALTPVATMSVTSADHHGLITFRAADSRSILAGALDLPCITDQSCYVNLVMWAWDSSARPGGADVLLVGQNNGDFLQNDHVDGDSARLMVIRERGITAADRDERESTGSGTVSLPLDASSVVIYSHQLSAGSGDLHADEQFYIDARAVVAVSSRARFSTQLFVTRDPHATDARSFDAIEPGAIGEHNGFNCTAGSSPCTTSKVAVFRVVRDVTGPVYVQLVAQSAVPGGGSAAVTVDRHAGFVRSTRYAATLR